MATLSRMKRTLILGSAVSVLFLYLAQRDIDWDVLWGALRETHAVLLVAATIVTVAGLYVRAYRWRFLLLAIKPISTHGLFSATVIGLMANNLLPARLGEFVRAYVLGTQESISRTASFATIVYERVVDVFTVLALLWITLLRIEGPEWLRPLGASLLAMNVALLVVLILMTRYAEPFNRILYWILRPLPEGLSAKIQHRSQAFVSGLAGIGRLSTLIPIVLTSILLIGLVTLSIFLCLEALDIHLTIFASTLLLVLLVFGSMIPSAPAYIGNYQYACIVGLGLFSVGKSEALAYSILFHSTQFFPTVLLGLFYSWRAGVRLGELAKNR